MKLSCALIVKNEEVMLSKCLDSVKGVDEIIIVDTGSTDKTLEIAKKHTDKIFFFKWCDDFSKARNFTNSKCSGDWILSIDADEVLEPDGIKKIRKAIGEVKSDIISLLVDSLTESHYFPKVYKNSPKVFWKGAIHNYLSVGGGPQYNIRIQRNWSPAHKNDPDRALRILNKEMERDPNLIRECYYLAREYYYRKNWPLAIDWFSKYVARSVWNPERADAYYLLAYCLWYNQQGEQARDACLQAIKINANFKQALELMAEMSWPVNKRRWLEFAQEADNSGVLFNRSPIERDSSYYDRLFEVDEMSRYEKINKMAGEWCSGRTLDIGCGVGQMKKYVKDWHGFDFSPVAVRKAGKGAFVGNAYDKSHYGDYDTYLLLEVLEHLDDYRVLKNIQRGKHVVFSVPSFKHLSHVRTFTEEVLRIRYRHFINIEEIVRFNWDGKWTLGIKDTPSYILLCRGTMV